MLVPCMGSGGAWGPSFLFAPLLKEASPLAAAVGAPEVAPAGAVVAAVVWAMITRSRAADA